MDVFVVQGWGHFDVFGYAMRCWQENATVEYIDRETGEVF